MIDFSQLYDDTIDSLFAFGGTYTTDREMIKDCIQDVFVKLYSKRSELRTVSNMESYLHVSLRNRINDEFRHNSHICDMEINENDIRHLLEGERPLDTESLEEEARRLQRVNECIKRLSPRQRQIIQLYYMERRKYDDICRIMGINYQSVRNLMHRSLSRLRLMAGKAGVP